MHWLQTVLNPFSKANLLCYALFTTNFLCASLYKVSVLLHMRWLAVYWVTWVKETLAWTHQFTNLFIEVPVPYLEGDHSCIYGYQRCLCLYFLLEFGTDLTVWYFFFTVACALQIILLLFYQMFAIKCITC